MEKRDAGIENHALDIGQHGGMIAFDRQEVVGVVVEHQFAGGLILGVQGIEPDGLPVEIEPRAQFAGGDDLVGLVGAAHATEVKLTGHGDGGDDVVAAAVLGGLPSSTINSSGGGAPRT